MITWVWLCQGCKFTGCFPVKFTTLNNNTTDCCSMSTNKLGCRVNNNISTIFDWSYKVRCCKCVIYNKRDFMCMSNLCNSFNVNHIRVRISKCFNVNSFCVILNCVLYFFKVEYINKCCCNSISRKCMLKQVCCSAVDVFGCNDMITLLCKIFNCVCDCCCTGCYCKCCRTPFKCCDSFLKYIFSRICKTSVNITCICKSETSCCVVTVSEHIRRCLVNRHCSCICNRIWTFLSYMKL